MSDYISREAAVTEVCDRGKFYKKIHDRFGGTSDICAAAHFEISELIMRLPAADVEQVRRWIPCSERLPEPETEVLVVCRRGGVSFVCPAMHEDGKMLCRESIWNWNEIDGYGLYSEENDDWFIPEGWWEYRQFNADDVYNNIIDCAVTHWMPLPEPPKEANDNGR